MAQELAAKKIVEELVRRIIQNVEFVHGCVPEYLVKELSQVQELLEAVEELQPFVWEHGMDEEPETDYERILVKLRKAFVSLKEMA